MRRGAGATGSTPRPPLWPHLIATHGSGLWPPVIDKLVVAAGYETALGAALGDDLTAATDEGAPRHWREAAGEAPMPSRLSLPEGRRAAFGSCAGPRRAGAPPRPDRRRGR